MCQTSNTQIFVLLTIYVENKYGKKACNHTNATNSPLSHIHNYKKKACNHNNPTNSPQSRTERKPAITPMQQTAHNHIWKDSLQSHQSNKQPTITYSHKYQTVSHSIWIKIKSVSVCPCEAQNCPSEFDNFELNLSNLRTLNHLCRK